MVLGVGKDTLVLAAAHDGLQHGRAFAAVAGRSQRLSFRFSLCFEAKGGVVSACAVVVAAGEVGIEGSMMVVADGDKLVYLACCEDVGVDVKVAGGEDRWG